MNDEFSRSLIVSSAGTASWHVGKAIDPRAAQALAERGYDPSDHLAQHATDQLLSSADLVVALDRKHQQILAGRIGHDRRSDLVMLRPYAGIGGQVDIADPYYGDQTDFDQCVAIIERSVDGLLASLRDQST